MRTYDIITDKEGALEEAGKIDYSCLPNNVLFNLSFLGEISWNDWVGYVHNRMLENYGEGTKITEEELNKEMEELKQEIFAKDEELKHLTGEDLYCTKNEYLQNL